MVFFCDIIVVSWAFPSMGASIFQLAQDCYIG
nr:MAG TPA: hypothetical protein [Caudoviricetes sp.]